MHIMQQDHCPIAIGQTVKVTLNATAHLIPLDALLQGRDVGFSNIHLIEIYIGFHRSTTGILAQPVKTDMSGNSVQPGGLCIFISERIATKISSQKCFLSQVFRSRGISDQAHNISEYTLVVFLEK